MSSSKVPPRFPRWKLQDLANELDRMDLKELAAATLGCAYTVTAETTRMT